MYRIRGKAKGKPKSEALLTLGPEERVACKRALANRATTNKLANRRAAFAEEKRLERRQKRVVMFSKRPQATPEEIRIMYMKKRHALVKLKRRFGEGFIV